MLRDEVIRKIATSIADAANVAVKETDANVHELVSGYASVFMCSLEGAYEVGVPWLTLERAVWDIMAKLNALKEPRDKNTVM